MIKIILKKGKITMKRKILSILAAMTFLASLIPAAVSAEDAIAFDGSTLRIEAEDCEGVPAGNIRSEAWNSANTYSGSAVGNTDISFSIDVAAAGLYKMSLQLENQYGDKTVEVQMNGETIFNGATSVGWAKLGAQVFDLELDKGINSFTIIHANNVRYDYVEFEASSVPTLSGTLRLEAEDYTVASAATEEADKWSGGKVVRSSPMSTSLYVAEPGVYKVDVKWGSKYSDTRLVELKVGDNVLFSGDTGIKYGAQVQSYSVELEAGLSSLSITSSQTLGNFYIDYVEFSPITNLVQLPKASTIKIEAEDYGSGEKETITNALTLSGGYRAINSDIEVNVYAEEAGTYEVTAAWGSKGEHNTEPVVIIDGVATDVKSFNGWWKSGVAHGNVTLKKGINRIKVAKGEFLWVDYIKISPAKVLTADKAMRLEAEDYATANATSTRHFESGNAYVYNNNTISTGFTVADGGEYVLTLASGGMSGDAPAIAINIDGTEVYNESNGVKVAADAGALTEGCVGLSQIKVTLTPGDHTIEIVPGLHALVDYVEFSKPVEYSEEKYPYELEDVNVDGALTQALVSTYLGEYSGSYDETMLNTAVKALGEDMSYVSWPFTTSAAGSYYLKVTYASAEASDAVCLVDSETEVSSSKWQAAYSNEAGSFVPPYFTEKYFDVGMLSAGAHNFVFMYDSANGTNEGVSIRKVELISAMNVGNGIISSEAQFAAEAVGDSASTAKLAANVSEACAYSSDSAQDVDKNTITVVKHIFNNSNAASEFHFIIAAYDSEDRFVALNSEPVSLEKGEQTDIKLKVSIAGASYVQAFCINMDTLVPVFDSELFGK